MENLKTTKVNKIGLKYLIAEESRDKISIKLGNRTLFVNISMYTFLVGWYKWQVLGQPVQDSFPMLTDSQREFIMTGIDDNQWNEIFKESEGNEND